MSETAARPEIRFKLSPGVARLAYPLPDAILALLFALAAAGLMKGDELAFVLLAEGAFLMMQGSLVDIATRLRKRPPIIVAILIVAALVLFLGHPYELLRMAWSQSPVVFLSLLLSLFERGALLWRMPGRSRIEKVAARALVSNRITTGLALLALVTAAMILAGDFTGTAILSAGALYYGIAALDDVRVRGRRFAEKPRVLFGFDPIHIEYLEPV